MSGVSIQAANSDQPGSVALTLHNTQRGATTGGGTFAIASQTPREISGTSGLQNSHALVGTAASPGPFAVDRLDRSATRGGWRIRRIHLALRQKNCGATGSVADFVRACQTKVDTGFVARQA